MDQGIFQGMPPSEMTTPSRQAGDDDPTGDGLRWGCCGSMIAPAADPVGIGIIETLAEIGYDYIELSLADLAALPEAAFEALAGRVARSGLPCEACNNFFPPRVRLTGAQASLPAALEYARAALERAARLGVRTIVFGSAGAKNVPEGFPREAAWDQLVELLGRLGPLAAGLGMTIAIEPLSRGEANIVNRAAEGLRLASEVGHPGVQLLIDYYHLTLEGEDPSVILQAGPALRHLHFAQAAGRSFPTAGDAASDRFFSLLHQVRYCGRCSIEAFTADFPADARRALRVMRDTVKRAASWLA